MFRVRHISSAPPSFADEQNVAPAQRVMLYSTVTINKCSRAGIVPPPLADKQHPLSPAQNAGFNFDGCDKPRLVIKPPSFAFADEQKAAPARRVMFFSTLISKFKLESCLSRSIH